MSTRRRPTLLIFLLFQSVYALTSSGNVFRVPDEFEVYFQTEHLVDAGDLSVPQTLAIRQPVVVDGKVVGSQPMFFGKIGIDRKPYAPYGPLVAVLALPHHLLGRALARMAGVERAPLPGGIAWLVIVGGITMLATATAAALAVAGFHRAVVALGTPDREAFALACLLGGATALWPYGTSFFSEAWQAAAFAWAAALLIEARGTPTGAKSRVVAASALLAVAGLSKMTSLVFTPAFVVAALAERSVGRRARVETVIVLVLGIALAATVHVLWNLFRFNQPFDLGYDWSETVPQPPARAFLASDVPRGLAVLLLSPGKSIVLWAPTLLLAAFGLRRFWRRERAIAAAVVCGTGVGLLFFAAYLFPEGGYSHGPRNLVPILPLLLLPAAGPDARLWPRPLVAVCAAVGLAVAVLATAVSFLEDQTLGGDLASRARTVYYERVDPLPGRVWNRYRLTYVPFVGTLSSPGWLRSSSLGLGPDYFPLHLLQARRQLSNRATIPLWLIWAPPCVWLMAIGWCARALRRMS